MGQIEIKYLISNTVDTMYVIAYVFESHDNGCFGQWNVFWNVLGKLAVECKNEASYASVCKPVFGGSNRFMKVNKITKYI
jgi:hypothetical protein